MRLMQKATVCYEYNCCKFDKELVRLKNNSHRLVLYINRCVALVVCIEETAYII